VVESGEVRVLLLLPVSQSFSQRQKQLLGLVGPGTMRGLSESTTREKYRITAEASE